MDNLQPALSDFQAIRIGPQPAPRRKRGCGCLPALLAALALLGVYILWPVRSNIVLLGIDDRAAEGVLGRSDTLILMTVKPAARYVGMLSIPRDLWVDIPGVGENRINTAHFFAEAAQPGSGPEAVKAVIEANFGVEVDYYVRASFDSFRQLVQILGGVQVTLDEPMGGYEAGTHLLDAEQALAFVRDRSSGGDDFARMRQTQALLRGLVQTALLPASLPRWPEMAMQAASAVETDMPLYAWPRLAMAGLLAWPDGLDGRVIGREMLSPFTTSQGAQVLAPRWELILPLVAEMFGR